MYGIPYVVEGYGIIYNKALTDKYFSSDWKATSYKSMDDINSFSKLKEIVEDMQKNKDKLGIEGVFASTSLKTGEDWRWQTHLANIPISYEFMNNNVDLNTDAYKEYVEQTKNYSKDKWNSLTNLMNDIFNASSLCKILRVIRWSRASYSSPPQPI